MLAFLLITAHLSLPANDQRLRIDVPAPKSVADIRPQASRYFLNIGEAPIEALVDDVCGGRPASHSNGPHVKSERHRDEHSEAWTKSSDHSL